MDSPPPPRPPEPAKVQPVPVEERVKDLLDTVESGYHSGTEWITLRKLYQSLLPKRGKSQRIDNLINMIGPVMGKYGYHAE